MQTPAQLKASRESKARRIAAGERQFTVWLSKVAGDRLDVLTATHGTRQKALEAALIGLYASHPLQNVALVAPNPSKPVSEPEKRPSVALKVRPAFNPQPKKGKK